MMREHPGRDPLPVIIWSASRQSGIQCTPKLFGAAYLCYRASKYVAYGRHGIRDQARARGEHIEDAIGYEAVLPHGFPMIVEHYFGRGISTRERFVIDVFAFD